MAKEIKRPKTYLVLDDGQAYYVRNKVLMACPLFSGGKLDLENAIAVADFMERLHPGVAAQISKALGIVVRYNYEGGQRLMDEHLKEMDDKKAKGLNIGWEIDLNSITSKTSKGRLQTYTAGKAIVHEWTDHSLVKVRRR